MTTQELIDLAQQRLFVAQDKLNHCSDPSARYCLVELSDALRDELVGPKPVRAWKLEPEKQIDERTKL